MVWGLRSGLGFRVRLKAEEAGARILEANYPLNAQCPKLWSVYVELVIGNKYPESETASEGP